MAKRKSQWNNNERDKYIKEQLAKQNKHKPKDSTPPLSVESILAVESPESDLLTRRTTGKRKMNLIREKFTGFTSNTVTSQRDSWLTLKNQSPNPRRHTIKGPTGSINAANKAARQKVVHDSESRLEKFLDSPEKESKTWRSSPIERATNNGNIPQIGKLKFKSEVYPLDGPSLIAFEKGKPMPRKWRERM